MSLPVSLREQRAAHAVAARLACGHARALGKDHDPVAFLEALLALLDDLRDGRVTGLAIDGDRVHLPHAPGPRPGSTASSRLSTHTWRGKTTIIAIVSQEEECFHSAMWQPSGSGAPSIR